MKRWPEAECRIGILFEVQSMSEGVMNYDGNLELNRVRFWFASVLSFLMFVPGTALLLFGIGKILVLPSSAIEFLYPYLTPFPERLLLVTISEKIPAIGRITFEDFAAVDVFIQQIFVVAFLCSILFAATLILQVRAGAPYPGLHNFSIVSPLTMSLGMLFLRELQVFFLIGKSRPAGRAEAVYLLLKFIAPASVVMTSCLLIAFIWMSGLILYRDISASID